jgi:predicted amidohydrolase YtcJ
MGWNQEQWADGRWPMAADLDSAFPDVPVVCSRIDGHAFWVNGAALQAAGISNSNGVLVDAEMDAIWKVLPALPREVIEQQLITASRAFAAQGVTEVHDMDVAPEIVEITRELAEQGKLAVRVQSFVSAQQNEWSTAGLLPAGGELQRTAGIKLYADGAVGSHGAAMLEPYSDSPSSGTLLLSATEIAERVILAAEAGWWCAAVHAIGDLAVRTVLDAFEIVRSHPSGREILLRVEHAQHVSSHDVPRFAQLNVVASVQPTHAISDAAMAESRLGSARLADAYRWRTLRDAGARIAAGTDAPIEHHSALRTLHAFVSRTPALAQAPWQPHETLTMDEALAASTAWAHEAADVSYRRGRIEVGMDADLVVLDRDPRVVGKGLMEGVKVLATFMAGNLQTT